MTSENVSKSIRAADAVKANPEKSNHAIANEIGVSEGTVRIARKSAGRDYAPEVRLGRDGKTYSLKQRPLRPKIRYRTERQIGALAKRKATMMGRYGTVSTVDTWQYIPMTISPWVHDENGILTRTTTWH